MVHGEVHTDEGGKPRHVNRERAHDRLIGTDWSTRPVWVGPKNLVGGIWENNGREIEVLRVSIEPTFCKGRRHWLSYEQLACRNPELARVCYGAIGRLAAVGRETKRQSLPLGAIPQYVRMPNCILERVPAQTNEDIKHVPVRYYSAHKVVILETVGGRSIQRLFASLKTTFQGLDIILAIEDHGF